MIGNEVIKITIWSGSLFTKTIMIGSGSIFRVIFALLILLRMYALYVKKKQKCEQKFKICLKSQIFDLA